jgi:hypothetical protein
LNFLGCGSAGTKEDISSTRTFFAEPRSGARSGHSVNRVKFLDLPGFSPWYWPIGHHGMDTA